jgi:autotransporter-associated beta strand protein
MYSRKKSRLVKAAKPQSIVRSLVGTLIVYASLTALISGAISTASNVFAGNPKDFTGGTSGNGTDMTSSSNYSPSGTPTNTDDVRITRSSSSDLRITSASVTMESLTVANGGSYAIRNATTGSTSRNLTLGNSAGFTNVFSGVADDLIYLTGSSSLTIQGPNTDGGTGVLNIVLASSGNFNIGTGSTLTISSAISGSGQSITKTGGGTVTLSGANTYSGGTTLNAGTLQIGSSSTGSVTNGPVGTGTLTLNGGTLSSNVGDFITVRSIANAITFGGDVTFGTNTNFGALAFSGAGTLTGDRTLTFIADVTYSGNIGESGGSFGITKNGSGTLKLSGFNTYSGGTTVNAGLLWLNSGGALGSASGSLTVNGGIVDLGGNSVTVGNLTGTGGTIWNNLNAQNTTATLTIGNGNTGGGNYQGLITNNNGATNGILALAKTGTGTITLSGANTYSGGTTVNGGTLLVNNTSGSGTGTGGVTVNNGGTLGGTGTISGTVTVNSGGTIRGGTGAAAAGTLTVNNTLTLNSNSVIQLALGPAGNHSTLALGGAESFQLTQQFNFIDLGAQTTTYSDIITGVTTPVVTAGWTITNPGWSGVFTYDSLNQSIDLTLTAVPEPATWFGAALAMSILLCTQRRRITRPFKRVL